MERGRSAIPVIANVIKPGDVYRLPLPASSGEGMPAHPILLIGSNVILDVDTPVRFWTGLMVTSSHHHREDSYYIPLVEDDFILKYPQRGTTKKLDLAISRIAPHHFWTWKQQEIEDYFFCCGRKYSGQVSLPRVIPKVIERLKNRFIDDRTQQRAPIFGQTHSSIVYIINQTETIAVADVFRFEGHHIRFVVRPDAAAGDPIAGVLPAIRFRPTGFENRWVFLLPYFVQSSGWKSLLAKDGAVIYLDTEDGRYPLRKEEYELIWNNFIGMVERWGI